MQKLSSSAYTMSTVKIAKQKIISAIKSSLKEDTAKLSCCGKKRQMLRSHLEVLDMETMTIKGMNSKK